MAKEDSLVHRELTESVIGCAMTVLNRLGCGLPEKVYERALIIELRKRSHLIDQQREFSICYEEICIGSLIPDLVIDEKLIVDAKVVANLAEEHVAQMLSNLSVTNLELALILNFRYPRLQWKRVVRQSSSA